MVSGNLAGIIILQLGDVAYNLAFLSANSRQKKVLQVFVVADGEGSIMVFSNSSMSLIGRSADRKALMVIETLSGSVHSG
jgi:hypothetical protein